MRSYRNLAMLAVCVLLAAPCAVGGETAGDTDGRLDALEEQVAALGGQTIKMGIVSEQEVVDELREWSARKLELLSLKGRFRDELQRIVESLRTFENDISMMADGPEKNDKIVELRAHDEKYKLRLEQAEEELMSKHERYKREIRDKEREIW